jgi:hypothetical protein
LRNSISISGKRLPQRVIQRQQTYTNQTRALQRARAQRFGSRHARPLDLEQAGQLIANAQEGILFLMFNPGHAARY